MLIRCIRNKMILTMAEIFLMGRAGPLGRAGIAKLASASPSGDDKSGPGLSPWLQFPNPSRSNRDRSAMLHQIVDLHRLCDGRSWIVGRRREMRARVIFTVC